jgi:hypothetical protein
MVFAGTNYLAIAVAAVAGFLFGALWYNFFSKPWLAAIGRTKEELQAKFSPAPFVIAFVATLVMAVVLAGILGHLGPGQVTWRNGVISAAFCWLGFVATTLLVNHAFQRRPFALTLIDGGHWLGVLLLQGLIIGLFGT